ncbi:MAG: class I SAM-dependent methyltransferase [Candidatus Binatia bacterium]
MQLTTGTTDVRALATNLTQTENGIWVATDRSGVSYPERGNAWSRCLEERSFWFPHRNHCIVEVVRQHPPTGPIFDIGGGNGVVSLALQESGYPAILVEPGLTGAQNAQRRGLQTVICSTLDHAGFKTAALPAIGIFDVIEHIEDERGFLSTLAQLLPPCGHLYITAPAYNTLWSYEDDYAGHHRRYTLSSLTTSLHRAGFTVEFATYLFFFLPLPVLLYRVLPSKLGVRTTVSLQQEQKEHTPPRGVLGRLLHHLLQGELRFLRKKWPVPFGSSCLLVATKR